MNASLADLSPAALAVLEIRSREVCVVYPNHRMPVGTEPAVARVGVESSNDEVKFFVALGLSYTGDDPEVAEWIRKGVKRFDSLGSLTNWIARGPSSEPVILSETLPEIELRPTPLPVGTVTSLGKVSVQPPASNAVSELDLYTMLRESVAGQEPAISTLAARVALHVNKPFPRKPYSAMMNGPTAVGKTKTAETIASSLADVSGIDWAYTRLDMSEFSEKHSVSRLIGAPPGYIGYGDDSLASRLAGNPNSVVLFDEIDKAHPVVLFTIMNLLDKGRLDSERYGSVTASKAILLFTSNMGATAIDGTPLDDRAGRMHLLQHGLAPELVGRFADILTFTQLDSEALAEIAALSVSTIAADYGVQIEWIDPSYLSNVLQRLGKNELGVRAVEYLIDADLGEQLAALKFEWARVDFDGTALVHGRPPTDNGEATTGDTAQGGPS